MTALMHSAVVNQGLAVLKTSRPLYLLAHRIQSTSPYPIEPESDQYPAILACIESAALAAATWDGTASTAVVCHVAHQVRGAVKGAIWYAKRVAADDPRLIVSCRALEAAERSFWHMANMALM
ncbi:hypothetical protein H9P43_007798 [Blastocladiella emersonii ATCC 22665]|nr:hypothetical protein H9P43_007798 [Blastocladiella emersonii ATCC 22665]